MHIIDTWVLYKYDENRCSYISYKPSGTDSLFTSYMGTSTHSKMAQAIYRAVNEPRQIVSWLKFEFQLELEKIVRTRTQHWYNALVCYAQCLKFNYNNIRIIHINKGKSKSCFSYFLLYVVHVNFCWTFWPIIKHVDYMWSLFFLLNFLKRIMYKSCTIIMTCTFIYNRYVSIVKLWKQKMERGEREEREERWEMKVSNSKIEFQARQMG